MPRKLALKRLTASDLTLFKWQFQNQPAGNQKAFNLDSRVLVRAMYPLLGKASGVPKPRFPIDLYLFGPGLAPEHNLQRKILRQEKNWRLNGELIDNPDEYPGRYNVLAEGDYALFEFSGDVVPDTAKVVLIARSEAVDAAIHERLTRRYQKGSMWLLDENEIAKVLQTSQAPETHPLYDWIESDALEDAALGGAEGIARVYSRRSDRGISPEEFLRARQMAEQTGVSGEELLNSYFKQELEHGRIKHYEWTASVNAISPFDFQITDALGKRRLVDAKSTTRGFSSPIHLSWNEIVTAVEGKYPYDIFRLYRITESSAKLRIAKDIGHALRTTYQTLNSLRSGVKVDAISIHPELLPFEEEAVLNLPDAGED